jgi:hypothetical protein
MDCDVSVKFTPQTTGPLSANVVVADDTLNSPSTQNVAVSGTGLAPPVSQYAFTGIPATIAAGTPIPFTLKAENSSNAVVTAYTGTVLLTSSDAQATFSLTSGGAPITSYTFTEANAGVRALYVTLGTAGPETITAEDNSSLVSSTSSQVQVTFGTVARLLPAGKGSSFSAVIGDPMASPFALANIGVLLSDGFGNPISGVAISYKAPATGASIESGSFTQTTGANGETSVLPFANGIAGGPYSVIATAAGLPGSPVTFTLTNLVDGSTSALAASPLSTATYGNPVTLTATVTPAATSDIVGPPTGTVSFYDTTTGAPRLLGNATLGGSSGTSPDNSPGHASPQGRCQSAVVLGRPSELARAQSGGCGVNISATATFVISAPAGGAHSYTASYGADSNFTASAASAVPFTVTKASVTVAGPAVQPVLLAPGVAGSIPVTVTGSDTNVPSPSGTITYSILNASSTSVASGTITLTEGRGSSSATIPMPDTLAPGTYTVSILYDGNSNYAATTVAKTVAVLVGQIQPVIRWAQPAAIVYGTTLSGVLKASAFSGNTAVPGTFTYTAMPSGGTSHGVTASTVLPAGGYTLSAMFAPADTTTYESAAGSVTLSVTQAAPMIHLASSANPVLVQNSTTLTATVYSAVSTPTGSVSFYDGSTLLGPGMLTSSGLATLTTSSLAVGSHSLTAVYGGDTNFMSVSSGVLTQVVQDFSLAIAASGGITSATALPGSTVVYTFTLSPVGSATFPETITLSATGLPTGATATFAPPTLAAGSGSTTVTMTVVLPQATSLNRQLGGPHTATPAEFAGTKPASKLPYLALGLLLLPFAGRLRKTGKRLGRMLPLLLLLAGLAAAAGLNGCGSTQGFFGQAPATYTIQVTGTSGALSHSTTVTLTVE